MRDLTKIKIGMTREQVREVLGEPDDVGGTSRKQKLPLVWKYVDAQLYFGTREEDGLAAVRMQLPCGCVFFNESPDKVVCGEHMRLTLEPIHIEKMRAYYASAESPVDGQAGYIRELLQVVTQRDTVIKRMKNDMAILHSWHYQRSQHEEHGCRCEGECVLAERAEEACNILMRNR